MFTKAVSRASLSLTLLTSFAASAFAGGGALYKFSPEHVAPLVALQEAVTLMDQRSGPIVSQPELEIFKKIAAGHPEECDTFDTILVTSGITDPEQRQKYAEKFDKIVDRADKAISGFETKNEKAQALAKYLLKYPMRGGFVEGQTNVGQLLDDGTYNCVSSALLYYAVGERVGIKTTASQIPQHIFLQIGDLCIEPTGGFTQSKAKHKKILDEQWAEAGAADAKIYGSKHYRQTNRMGLIGDIYYDISCGNGNIEQESAAALKACCMCPTNTLYAAEAGVNIHNWAVTAYLRKDFAKSKKIAMIAGQLYGDEVSGTLFKLILDARNGR